MTVDTPLVARLGSELVVTPANPLLPRTVITLDDLPWVPYVGADGDISKAMTLTKTLCEPESGNHVMLVRLLPGAKGPTHWHTSDTVYIMRQGELHIEKEGTFGVGDVRWARGGFAYAPEIPGPGGAEFFFISVGPYGLFFADETPPPLGSWDDPEPA